MMLAATGHRLKRLGGYDQHTKDKVYRVAHDALEVLSPTTVISGMALGWDMAVAQAALDLKIQLFAYVPFEGQEKMWPVESQIYYRMLVDRAAARKVCSTGGYAAYKMHIRNEKMINDADEVLALWDGVKGGGTYAAVQYARGKQKRIHNVWPRFKGAA